MNLRIWGLFWECWASGPCGMASPDPFHRGGHSSSVWGISIEPPEAQSGAVRYCFQDILSGGSYWDSLRLGRGRGPGRSRGPGSGPGPGQGSRPGSGPGPGPAPGTDQNFGLGPARDRHGPGPGPRPAPRAPQSLVRDPATRPDRSPGPSLGPARAWPI